MEFQYPVDNQLTLIDLRTNKPITIEVSPTMTLDDVTKILKEKGIVQQAETVLYGKIKEDGSLQPLNAYVVEDLLALQRRGQRIAIVVARVD
jgi:hypothetical protein